jgi:hypothetical protein
MYPLSTKHSRFYGMIEFPLSILLIQLTSAIFIRLLLSPATVEQTELTISTVTRQEGGWVILIEIGWYEN